MKDACGTYGPSPFLNGVYPSFGSDMADHDDHSLVDSSVEKEQSPHVANVLVVESQNAKLHGKVTGSMIKPNCPVNYPEYTPSLLRMPICQMVPSVIV